MTTDSSAVLDVLLTDIHADIDFNCRGVIAPIDVVDLARSIDNQGLIQPVVISPYDEDKQKETGFKYLLIAGYRRYKAHQVLERKDIKSIVREGLNETSARILNLAENLDREDLNILQEAKAISRLKELNVTEMDTAKELNKSRGWVQVRFMLLDLPNEIQQEAAAGFLTQTDIRSLYSLGTRDERLGAAKRIKEAKQRGQNKISKAVAVVKKKSDKRVRKRPEIFSMMEHASGIIGNGLYSRAFAWCAGEISDHEFLMDIKIKAESDGLVYEIPADGDY
jgi:ParB family chromosome partitioning protein